jgi:hypothetical protein
VPLLPGDPGSGRCAWASGPSVGPWRRLEPGGPSLPLPASRDPRAEVRFTAEHRFPGAPEAIAAVLKDPTFYEDLELPDLRLRDVQPLRAPDPSSPRAAGPSQGIFLRYEFTGNLDAMARRLLGGARLTWSQEVRLCDASGGQLTFAAEANPGLLHGRADFTLEIDRPGRTGEASGVVGESTVRRLEGELIVAIPVVGPMAERRIVPGVLTRLDVEAEAVRHRLTPGHRAGGAS